MKPSFSRNIDSKGRLIRAFIALLFLAGAAFAFNMNVWLALGLLSGGVFVAFEALRGWCALRACGIRTKF